MVEALIAKGNPEIQRCEAKAVAETVLVLKARGIAVSAEQRQEILYCDDRNRLNHWLRQAAVASAGEIMSEP